MAFACEALQATAGRSVLEAVGNTPLVRLAALEREVPGVELYAKAEWLNPGGSVKDRPAARMICEALKTGALTSDRRILDATSGNTGIAYAMIGAALGYGVTLCVPSNITPERKRILRAYGPELIFTDPLEGSDGAIREARRRFAAKPDAYFYADQYSNPFNWRAHYDTTAAEIWEQTSGRITHFIAGLGTSGTFVGTGRRLRELNPSMMLVSVQPDSPLHGLEGLKHMASAIVPGIYDPALANLDLGVSTEDAYKFTRRLAAEEGLLVGISSGANLAGAMSVLATGGSAGLKPRPPSTVPQTIAQDGSSTSQALRSMHEVRGKIEGGRGFSPAGPVAVIIFPDGGERYLSERFWDEAD